MSNFRSPGSLLPEMTPKQREDWIIETVVAGIKDAEIIVEMTKARDGRIKRECRVAR